MVGSSVNAVATVDRFIPSVYEGKIDANYYCRGWNSKRNKYCRSRAGAGTDHTGSGRCKLHGGSKPVTHGQERRDPNVQSTRIHELLTKHLENEDPLNVLRELALARALLEDWVARYETYVAALTAWYDTWEGKRIPISTDEKAALLEALGEYELLLSEMDDKASDRQHSTLELAKSAVEFLATPQEPKPRQLLDVTDAMRHIDVISKVIYRVEQTRQSGAISLDQLKRFMFALERVIETRVRDADVMQQIKADLLGIRV